MASYLTGFSSHAFQNKPVTVEPVYYGHIVLIFQVSLHNKSFGTTARCVDYAGVHIFKCPD